VVCGFFRLAGWELDGGGEQRRLGSVVLQDQGRVDPGSAGDAPHGGCLEPSVAEFLSRRIEDPGL
jgi:hypothetical protein